MPRRSLRRLSRRLRRSWAACRAPACLFAALIASQLASLLAALAGATGVLQFPALALAVPAARGEWWRVKPRVLRAGTAAMAGFAFGGSFAGAWAAGASLLLAAYSLVAGSSPRRGGLSGVYALALPWRGVSLGLSGSSWVLLALAGVALAGSAGGPGCGTGALAAAVLGASFMLVLSALEPVNARFLTSGPEGRAALALVFALVGVPLALAAGPAACGVGAGLVSAVAAALVSGALGLRVVEGAGAGRRLPVVEVAVSAVLLALAVAGLVVGGDVGMLPAFVASSAVIGVAILRGGRLFDATRVILAFVPGLAGISAAAAAVVAWGSPLLGFAGAALALWGLALGLLGTLGFLALESEDVVVFTRRVCESLRRLAHVDKFFDAPAPGEECVAVLLGEE